MMSLSSTNGDAASPGQDKWARIALWSMLIAVGGLLAWLSVLRYEGYTLAGAASEPH